MYSCILCIMSLTLRRRLNIAQQCCEYHPRKNWLTWRISLAIWAYIWGEQRWAVILYITLATNKRTKKIKEWQTECWKFRIWFHSNVSFQKLNFVQSVLILNQLLNESCVMAPFFFFFFWFRWLIWTNGSHLEIVIKLSVYDLPFLHTRTSLRGSCCAFDTIKYRLLPIAF